MVKSTSNMTRLTKILDEMRVINKKRADINTTINVFKEEENELMKKSVGLNTEIQKILYDETNE